MPSSLFSSKQRPNKSGYSYNIGFGWAYWVGEWVVEHQPIKIKKHGREAKSIFCTEFDFLRQILLNLNSRQAQICPNSEFFVLYLEGNSHHQSATPWVVNNCAFMRNR